ncbi:Carbohydrate-Binding Module Family 14 protein [Gigaspora rosea]|uniref:Carbohydrate-Binding Module Family 14 protein n=1 Tax=Gigaspora rosea TaxID=44941 RepID=A0A397W978_9GLOM|nr:Carbohydrate-Binding Module Family 14 protein [Gigaspora rosea]
MKFIRKSIIIMFIMMPLYTIFVFGFTCPEENDESNPNGLYRNPEDCKTFYQCSNGVAYLFDCPDDLQWNTYYKRCEWPANSDCALPNVPPP